MQVDEGNKIVNNYTLVGRVPSGGKVTTQIPAPPDSDKEMFLSLADADITTAQRVAQRINIEYGTTAYAMSGGSVRIVIPDTLVEPTRRMRFLSDIGHLQVEPDGPARVVVNERTGTIVAGENVTVEPVAIAHGTITVNIQSRPVISQPEPFSSGQTVQTKESEITVTQETARVIRRVIGHQVKHELFALAKLELAAHESRGGLGGGWNRCLLSRHDRLASRAAW